MYLYKTVDKNISLEYIEKKSKFIAHIKAVNTFKEAQDYVKKIKLEYKDATHNVPAIICGNKQEIKWASDDGEPSGTSGMPILKMLSDQGLTNLVVVVTRYFGGIKLGTGGLARAYTTAVKLVLENAGICEVSEGINIEYEMDYSFLKKLENLSKNGTFSILDVSYSDKITVSLNCLLEHSDQVQEMIKEMTSSKVKLISLEKTLNRTKIS